MLDWLFAVGSVATDPVCTKLVLSGIHVMLLLSVYSWSPPQSKLMNPAAGIQKIIAGNCEEEPMSIAAGGHSTSTVKKIIYTVRSCAKLPWSCHPLSTRTQSFRCCDRNFWCGGFYFCKAYRMYVCAWRRRRRRRILEEERWNLAHQVVPLQCWSFDGEKEETWSRRDMKLSSSLLLHLLLPPADFYSFP